MTSEDRRDLRPAQPRSGTSGASPLSGHSADEIAALELLELAVSTCAKVHGVPTRSPAVHAAVATLVDVIAEEAEQHA